MLETKQVSVLFADARAHYAQALDQLERGQLQKAAGKAWDATLKATDGLILARTGEEPRDWEKTDFAIRQLALADPSLRALVTRYGARHGLLLEACVYDGICDPEDDLTADIRETRDFIKDAERLAGQ